MNVKEYQKQEGKQRQAYEYFVAQGYSPQAAAGIVGNLVHESNLNTTVEGDIGYKGGSSRAIAQWRGERLKRLKEKYGNNWTDFNNQLEFVKYELETTHKKANERLRNSKDAYEAGQAFSDLYEIPAVKYKDNKNRQNKVNKIYSLYANQQPTITQDFSNYENPTPLPKFATSPVALQNLPEIETAEEQEPQEVAQARENLQQKTNEYNFLQEYLSQQPQQTAQIAAQQMQQNPVLNVFDQYAQVSQFVENPVMQEGGQIPISPNGVYDYPNQEVIVPTNGSITMKNVDTPLMGISLETGEKQMMMPNLEYFFNNTRNVLEIPMK